MVEAGLLQRLELLALEQHGGGDEVGVEPALGGGLDDVHEVAARRRLAAGEMDLQDAEGRRLAHDPLPVLGRKLGVGALELERVGAVGALQRAACASAPPGGRSARARRRRPARLVGLPSRRSASRRRRASRVHSFTWVGAFSFMPSPLPCLRDPAASRRCRRGSLLVGALYSFASTLCDVGDGALAITKLQNFDSDVVGLEDPLGRQDQPAAAARIVAQLDVAPAWPGASRPSMMARVRGAASPIVMPPAGRRRAEYCPRRRRAAARRAAPTGRCT